MVAYNRVRCKSCVSGIVRIRQQKGDAQMDLDLILSGKATLEDLCVLHGLGYQFIIEDGEIKYVLHPRQL